MSVFRARVDLGGNNVQAQPLGARMLTQEQLIALTTAGNGTITAAMLMAGIINRSGPAAGYTDTFPSADSLLQAQPELSVGDAFRVLFRNTVAQAMTAAAGEGCVLGTSVNIAASLTRDYLVTILGTGPRQLFQGTTVNADATITGIPLDVAANIQPGQGITGTGVPANTTVISVNQALGTLEMSANATAGATVTLTTFPRYQLQGLGAAAI